MTKTIGQFAFDLVAGKPGDDLPFDPFVRLSLAQYSTSEGKGAMPEISAQLATEREIDEHIRDLKADLDRVGQEAKAALRKARATLARK